MCKGSDHDGGRALLGDHGARAHRLPGGEGGGDAWAARGEVVRHWVPDHLQEPLGTVRGPHTELVQQLDWEGVESQRED